MIIAVDYDGTLEIDGNLNINLIRRLRHAQAGGDRVILWTCRSGKRLNEATARLRGARFIPNAVNENLPDIIKTLGCNPRKVLADVYIDDKAVK